MSGFDQFIDAIAFGKEKATSGPCLGLYLSPETIYVAQVRPGKGGAPAVDHLVRIPVPQEWRELGAATGSMTMSADFLGDPAGVGGLIRQSMSPLRWSSRNVVVTLSHHLGLLRFFPMPAIENRFLGSAVPLEAKKYIPIPFDALAYDFQTAPLPPDEAGKARIGALIAVTQRKNVLNVQGLIQFLGLKMVGLEVAPCSVLRLWQAVDPPKAPEPVVRAHFDGGSVRVMVCDRGVPVLFREIFLTGELTLNDQRKIDLPGCLAFARKQLGLSEVSKITLSGAPEALDPWKESLAREAGLPAEIQDVAGLLSIKGGDWGGYAAIGASVRALAPTTLALDMGVLDRVTEEERRTARDIILAGAAAAGLIACGGVLGMLSAKSRARELASYKVDLDVKAALAGLPPAEIEGKLREMREQLDRVQAAAGSSRAPLSAVLREVIELMPENVWLHKINVSDSLMSDMNPFEVALRGRARGASISEEQSLAHRFKDTLLASPLGKSFDVQIEVRSKPSLSEGGSDVAGLEPAALARKLEDRTEFILILKRKR